MTICNLQEDEMEPDIFNTADQNKKNNISMGINLLCITAGLGIWWAVYRLLPDIASWLTYNLLTIKSG